MCVQWKSVWLFDYVKWRPDLGMISLHKTIISRFRSQWGGDQIYHGWHQGDHMRPVDQSTRSSRATWVSAQSMWCWPPGHPWHSSRAWASMQWGLGNGGRLELETVGRCCVAEFPYDSGVYGFVTHGWTILHEWRFYWEKREWFVHVPLPRLITRTLKLRMIVTYSDNHNPQGYGLLWVHQRATKHHADYRHYTVGCQILEAWVYFGIWTRSSFYLKDFFGACGFES